MEILHPLDKMHFEFKPSPQVKAPWTKLAETIQCLWRSFYYSVVQREVEIDKRTWDNYPIATRTAPQLGAALYYFKKIHTIGDNALGLYFEGLSKEHVDTRVDLRHSVTGERDLRLLIRRQRGYYSFLL